MNAVESPSLYFRVWLIDYWLVTSLLMGITLLACRFIRQPLVRLIVTKTSLVGLVVVGGLVALPHWPRVVLGTLPPANDTAANAVEVRAPAAIRHIDEAISMSIAESPDGVAPGDAVVSSSESPETTHGPTLPSVTAEPDEDMPAAAASSARDDGETIVSHVGDAPLAASNLDDTLMTAVGAAYVVGSGFVICWLAVGAGYAVWLLRRSKDAPNSIRKLLADVAGRQDHLPRLVTNPTVRSALVLCAWRPTIVLPNGAADDRREALVAIAHEWAHVCHGDLWTLALERLLAIVLYPHPFFWLLRRQVRADQESLADARAARTIGREVYVDHLLRWARRQVSPARVVLPATMGLWDRPSLISERVGHLLDDCREVHLTAGLMRRVLVIGGVVLSATLLSTLTLSAHRLEGPALTEPAAVEFSSLPSDDAPPVPEVVPPAGHPAETEDNAVLDRADVFPPFDITGQVSDEGGTPVAAAQVTLLDLTHDQVVAETTTDRAGHYTFAKPKLRVGIAPLASPHFEELDIAVVASAAGHGLAWESVRRLLLRRRGDVRYQISSEGALDSFVFAGRAVDAEDEPLRLEVNPRLTAARVLSGRVVDARGRAVPSARVTLASLVGSEPLPVPAEDSTVTGNLRVAHSALGTRIVAATTTDENGRWSLAGLPDDAQVSVAVSLPQGGRDDLIGRAENATGEVTAALDGSPTEANEIILPAMRHVDVLLRNSLTQQPLSGVDLSISQSLELGHQVRVTAVTDERGSASLWLPVGDCRARFFYRETDDKFAALTEVEQTFPVALGADAQQIELDVTPRPLVRIRVIDDATGLPVPNVQIDARRILAQGARASNELLPSGFSDRRGRITSLMPPGRWQFFVADQQLALEHGYRVLDPATEPVDLVSGNTYRYEFRVAKTSGSTLPQIQDDIKFASFLHQTAVASLRRHGVMVTTRLGAAPEKDPSGVVAYAVVTPHWSGVPQELDGLWQLDELAALIFGGPMMNPAGNVRTEVVVRDEMLQSMRGRKLETLVVEKADVTGDGLAALTTVQGLKQLTLGAETLDAQALSQIGRIRSLEMLNLNAPHIDTNDLRPLADLDRLTTLVVRTNASIRDTTSDIGKGSLVDATAHADDAFLQRAAKRPQLKTLKVTGAESSDAGIAHLAQYSWNTLMLGGPMPGVTDNSLETFERMSELKELTLFDMTFSEAGLKRFRETRPDVAIRVMNRNAAAANAAQ